MEGGFLGQRLGEAEQTGLGCRIVRLADGAGLTDHRRHHDDAPTSALDHVTQCCLGEEEGTREIHIDDLVPVVVGHLGHGPVNGNPGIVDENVETPVLLEGLCENPTAVVTLADVAAMQAEGLSGKSD
jgi:hypothetical protein